MNKPIRDVCFVFGLNCSYSVFTDWHYTKKKKKQRLCQINDWSDNLEIYPIYCNDYILDQSKVNFIQAVSSVPLSPGPRLDVGHTLF